MNTTSIRNNLHKIGQRLEDELGKKKGVYIEGCPRDWEELPRPDLPLVLGMDGGYVRSYDFKSRSKGNFEVIVGKSIKADGTSKRFGGVHCYDTKPQRRIFEVLTSLGMQMNQQVTFLSDDLICGQFLTFSILGIWVRKHNFASLLRFPFKKTTIKSNQLP